MGKEGRGRERRGGRLGVEEGRRCRGGKGKEGRSLYTSKHKIKKMKEHPTEWKKILEDPVSAKSPGCRIHRDKTTQPASKWSKLQM